MTQVRRVTRRFDCPRTLRPSGFPRPVSPALRAALFHPADGQGDAQTLNLFLDLDAAETAPHRDARAERARARMSRAIAGAGGDNVTNIFAEAEDESQWPDGLELRLTAVRAARPRKMETIRTQMAEVHAQHRAEARYPTAKEAIGLAAGVIFAMMFLPLPPLF